jgi:hypothetical protein
VCNCPAYEFRLQQIKASGNTSKLYKRHFVGVRFERPSRIAHSKKMNGPRQRALDMSFAVAQRFSSFDCLSTPILLISCFRLIRVDLLLLLVGYR